MGNAVMSSKAWISPDRQYRYCLTRIWDSKLPTVTFVMLNPSTADEVNDDPTIRRCMGFARAEGFGALEVMNLYAFRATDPRVLFMADDPVGPQNDEWLRRAANNSMMLAAWGTKAKPDRVREFLMGPAMGHEIYCLGKTKHGAPRHPLYLPAKQPLERFF